jgi:hypothetical protein
MADPYCVQDRQGIWHISKDGEKPALRNIEERCMCGEKIVRKPGVDPVQRAPNCHACQAKWDAR